MKKRKNNPGIAIESDWVRGSGEVKVLAVSVHSHAAGDSCMLTWGLGVTFVGITLWVGIFNK